MSSRVYIGHLASRATERDIEKFFRGFGRIRDIVLKNGFGFVEFDDSRDAEDAVYDLNGRDLCGERVIVELSRRGPRAPGGYRGGGGPPDRYGGGGGGGGGRNFNSRHGPPIQTRYRMLVHNLSTRCSWQDLKDLMRNAGEVTYADAHKKVRNEAIVCFASSEDLRRAMDKYQGKDINGRKIKLIDDTEGGGGGGGRRSRTPRSRSPRSRSHSRDGSRSRTPRSRSPRSRSNSPRENSPRKASRSHSPAGRRSASGSRSRSRSSHSSHSGGGSRSRSPIKNGK